MRRILLLLTVVAVMALMMATTAGAASARAIVSGCTSNFVLTPSGNVNEHFGCHFHGPAF